MLWARPGGSKDGSCRPHQEDDSICPVALFLLWGKSWPPALPLPCFGWAGQGVEEGLSWPGGPRAQRLAPRVGQGSLLLWRPLLQVPMNLVRRAANLLELPVLTMKYPTTPSPPAGCPWTPLFTGICVHTHTHTHFPSHFQACPQEAGNDLQSPGPLGHRKTLLMSRAEAAFIVWGFFLHILQKHYLVSPGPWRLPQSRKICLGPETQATSFSSCSLTALRPESRESWWMEVLYVWFEVLFFSLFLSLP